MKRESTARLVAAALMGLSFGLYIRHDYDTWSQRGRDAFMAYQGHRFDQYMLVPRHSIAGMIGFIIVVCILIGFYELVATGIAKILGPDRQL